MASTVTDKVLESGTAVRDRGAVLLNSYVTPSQRRELSQSLQNWTAHNPKLAGFLTAQVMLSGPPVILFLAFTFTVLTTSLLVCAFTALTLALTFTVFCTGLAFLVLLPTLLITTITAGLLFISGVVGSAAILKFNNDPRTEGMRSRAKSNASALAGRVKEASNGSLDFNAAAEHLTNQISSSSSQTVGKSTEEAASEAKAKEYLARQALGIPERVDIAPNGDMTSQQNQSLDAAIDVTSGSYVQSADQATSAEKRSPEKSNELHTGRLQVVS